MLELTNSRVTHWNGVVRPGLSGVAVIVATCAVTGATGALVSVPAIEGWYAGFSRPSWTPPGWMFGLVWTALCAAMAVAGSIVWLSRHRHDVCCPLTAFAVQLVLNLTWSVSFFGLKSPLLGFLDVCLLWVVVAVTTAEFFLVSSAAGWLMVPYWVWVTFAAALNGAMLIQSA